MRPWHPDDDGRRTPRAASCTPRAWDQRSARYTLRMDRVGDLTRRATNDLAAAMGARERIALSLALGDDDLRLFMAASHLNRDEAIARLRRTRQHGRRPSVAGGLEGA